MKKEIILGALLVIAVGQLQAQSTASGSSNTGNPTANAAPAQNGSTGNTVNPKANSTSKTNAKSSGRKMKATGKTTKTQSSTSSGR